MLTNQWVTLAQWRWPARVLLLVLLRTQWMWGGAVFDFAGARH